MSAATEKASSKLSHLRQQQPDDRAVRRFIKRFVAVSSCSALPSTSSAEEVEEWREDLLANYFYLLGDFGKWKEEWEEKVIGVRKWAEEERMALGAGDGMVTDDNEGAIETEKEKIERACEQTAAQISTLTLQLESSLLSRSRKLAYNSLSRQIASHPSRASSVSTIQRLESEIAELQSERDGYGSKWAARREVFDAAVATLNELGEAIKEEKFREARRLAGDVDLEAADAEENENNSLEVGDGDGGEGEVREGEEGERREGDDGEEGEERGERKGSLNPDATPFIPKSSGSVLPSRLGSREPGEMETGENTPRRSNSRDKEESGATVRRRMVNYGEGDTDVDGDVKMGVEEEGLGKRRREDEDEEMEEERSRRRSRRGSMEEGEMEN
ncbi:hypothetical protein BT69DRAFT_1339882 [Atractiella rhizophila]|nr:hypothetical protein BT69DRAFT_1339882 [Atractiella rhizophila]